MLIYALADKVVCKTRAGDYCIEFKKYILVLKLSLNMIFIHYLRDTNYK